MIKDKLCRLDDIRKEIKKTKEKLKKLEEKDTELYEVEESYKRPPFTKHNITIKSQTKKTRDSISKYKSILQERHNNLLDAKIEVEEFINELPNARLQRIFEMKHIDNYSWTKIAYIIGRGATADSVRKEHDRFLEKI